MSKRIGEVIAVVGAYVTIEVDADAKELHVRHAGKTYTIGRPGSYLVADSGHDKCLILVTTVRRSSWLDEGDSSSMSNSGSSQRLRNFPYPTTTQSSLERTLIDGVLVGIISGKSFEVGTGRMPVVGDPVVLATEGHLRTALAPAENRSQLSIGNSVDAAIPVFLDLDHLCGKHAAILGTTGCGKSYTVARVIDAIASKYPAANVVVFDLHGEYATCFGDSCRYVRADEMKFPAWVHPFDDLFQLCADFSNQFNIHNQRWAFRDGVFQLKQRFCRDVMKDETLAEKLDLDAPIPFAFAELQHYLHNRNSETRLYGKSTLALEDREVELKDGQSEVLFAKRLKFKQPKRSTIETGPLRGDLDRLVLRVDARVNDPRYAFMFDYELPSDKNAIEQQLQKVSGFAASDRKPITVYDLSFLPSETVGTVVATISRILFQIHFLSHLQRTTPTLLVYEEAHNYIAAKGTGAYGEARESVERIAKEGRKFGIGVLAASQRPSELSDTLLSQCNSFLCMRMTNDIDKRHVVQILPDSMSGLIDVLPALPRGHLIAIGQATKLPIHVRIEKFDEESKEPASKDPPFGEIWTGQIEHRPQPNLTEVSDSWIHSQRAEAEARNDVDANEA